MAEGIVATEIMFIPGFTPDDQVQITVVLKEGAVGDYAAYIASSNDLDYVCQYGIKLPFSVAAGFFPHIRLEEESYRR